MNKVYKAITIVSILLSIGSFVGIGYIYKSQPKVAFVRVGYLYDNFEYKKELEGKLDNVVKYRKTVIDSLEFKLKLLAQKIQSSKDKDEEKIAEFKSEKDNYLMKKQQFDDDNADMNKQYTQDIMKQLNQYVQDYGKANGYTYIYGAEGNGGIMSADDKNDITTTVSEYVNERYKGKK